MAPLPSRWFIVALLLGWICVVRASEVSVDVTGEVEVVSEDEGVAQAESSQHSSEGVAQVESSQPDSEGAVATTPADPERGESKPDPLLRILYSSSQEKNYEPAVNFIEERFPELRGKFTGGFYPQAPIPEFLVRVLQMIQLGGIVWMIVGGKKLLRMLPMYKAGRPLPGFYWTIQDNPVPIAIFLYLIAPPLLSKMKASNAAFEVYLDDALIFSLREAGRLQADEFMKVFRDAGFTFVEPPK